MNQSGLLLKDVVCIVTILGMMSANNILTLAIINFLETEGRYGLIFFVG